MGYVDPGQFRLGFNNHGLVTLKVGIRQRQRLIRLVEECRRLFRKQGNRPLGQQFIQPLLAGIQREQQRLNPPNPLQATDSGAGLGMLLSRPVQGLLAFNQRLMPCFPVVCAQGSVFEFVFRLLEGFLGHVVFARSGFSGGPQRIRFGLQLLQHLPEMFHAGGRLKKHSTQIVGSRQDTGSAFDEQGVIQGVHPVEGGCIQPAQPGVQDALWQQVILRGAERVFVAFRSLEGQR